MAMTELLRRYSRSAQNHMAIIAIRRPLDGSGDIDPLRPLIKRFRREI
jgi:hypothetical protein